MYGKEISHLFRIKGLYGNTSQGADCLSGSQEQKSNKKQKARFSITKITNEDFSKLLKKFNNSPYLGYKSKQVHNEPTETYFSLIKHITKKIKIKRHVQLRTNFVKSDVNKKMDTSMKQLDMSTKQFNMRNWKAST